MIQNTEPMATARIQNAPERIRSITEPDTMDAAVHEKSRNAAQNTPLMRAHPFSASAAPPMCAPITSLQGTAWGASTRPPVNPGPLGNAK